MNREIDLRELRDRDPAAAEAVARALWEQLRVENPELYAALRARVDQQQKDAKRAARRGDHPAARRRAATKAA